MHVMDLLILALYGAIISSTIHNVFISKNSQRSSEMILWIVLFNITLMIQASSYLYLQSDWIFNGYDQVISDSSAMWWKVYDWANGSALFAFSRVLGIALIWRE